MTLTPAHLPEMSAGQAQKEVTFNEAMVEIGTLFAGVLSATESAPPADPDDGDAYIVGAAATGLWAGREGQIAQWLSGWRFTLPFRGPQLWVADEGQWWTYDGSNWGVYNPGAGVVGPGSSVSGNIPTFNGAGGDNLQDSGKAFSTDGTLASNSDDKIPTEKAVKAYADALLAAQDAMVFKGAIDCSANPNYPAADRGHTYRVSVAGKIGGAAGVVVQVGDIAICLTDGTASGDQATVGASWSVIQTNIDGAVVGPASAVDGGLALFDGTSGKLLKGDGLSPSNDDFLQRKGGAWANRTPSQVLIDLQGSGLDVDAAGFRGIPLNSQSGNYTTVAADAGKAILHPSGAGAGDTITIDSNANVAYEVGTALSFINADSSTVSIAIASDTLYLAGTTTSGTRQLAQNGIATALKVASTTWIISGVGLT